MYKFVKLITETSSKIFEFMTYNKIIKIFIHVSRWRETVEKELQNLDTYQTWCYTLLPDNQKAIHPKQVFKVKYNSNGSIERYKARLVVQKFSQVYGIDYTETFA